MKLKIIYNHYNKYQWESHIKHLKDLKIIKLEKFNNLFKDSPLDHKIKFK